ncbi:MAG: hypothetical protein M1507_04945 [Candidatus Thermoplasmatota archaeon]|nr:hypothetical protein [Candidatus Thermoplasmatota archaeon]
MGLVENYYSEDENEDYVWDAGVIIPYHKNKKYKEEADFINGFIVREIKDSLIEDHLHTTLLAYLIEVTLVPIGDLLKNSEVKNVILGEEDSLTERIKRLSQFRGRKLLVDPKKDLDEGHIESALMKIEYLENAKRLWEDFLASKINFDQYISKSLEFLALRERKNGHAERE